MTWNEFTIGFWHTFGDHGHHRDGSIERAEHILRRKVREVSDNGWTLWSFNGHSKLPLLLAEIGKERAENVYAVCGGKKPKAPKGEPRWCGHYRLMGESEWRVIPESISVPHPGKGKHIAAFKVKGIEVLPSAQSSLVSIEWFSTKTGRWTSEFPPGKKGYPGIQEKLIRRSFDGASLRPVRAVLELAEPFLVWLK